MDSATGGVTAAHEAVSRYAWREGFDLFAAADAAAPLDARDLDAMAECAWWIGKMRHCIALRERAHGGYLKAGDVLGAARVATELAGHHADLTEFSSAAAWLQKASRLLEDEPEAAEHGWLVLARGFMARGEGDWHRIGALASQAADIAARFQDKDLWALAHAVEGLSLAFGGADPDAGLRMIEESTVGAVNGELGARATGSIYCMMIATNAHTHDWERAGRWTEAATTWCDRQAINGFPGVCRVHRAEIMRLRGDLAVAEEEARTASVELASFNLEFAALAFKELGEVRLKLGDLDAAEEAFGQAQEMGVTPQPGLTEVLVQRGNLRGAAASIRRALADRSISALDRAKLLPTQVEVALATGDIDTAASATGELGEIAAVNGRPALRAAAAYAVAAVALARGELDAALAAAQDADALYCEVDLIYEGARARRLVGEILRARGDAAASMAELTRALTTFEGVGAVPDMVRTRELIGAQVG